MTRLLALIDDARRWREWHRARGNTIEAAAAAVREQALRDAVKALKDRAP
jgi:hypothetical protein